MDNEEEYIKYNDYSREEEEYFDRVVDWFRAVKCELSDTSPIGSYPLTITLIVVNVLVAVATGGVLFMKDVFAIETYPSLVCIASGDCILGLFFSMFSHANIIHLVGNMFFLYTIGDNVEIALGRLRYFIVYITSGVVGAYVQAIITLALDPVHAAIPAIGASAAISGVLAGYLLLYPGASRCLCIGYGYVYKCTKLKAAGYALIWILLQFLYIIISPFIGVWAHLGGFFTGLVLTYLLVPRSRVRELREMLIKGKYRGLAPDPGACYGYSLGSTVRFVIAGLSLIVTVLLLTSTLQLVGYMGEYYVVGVDFQSNCSSCLCEAGECNCSGCTWSVASIWYVISKIRPDEPVESIMSLDPSPQRTVRLFKGAYSLSDAIVVALIILLVSTALTTITIYIMHRGYREVDATYLALSNGKGEFKNYGG
jgi:membrane associated rhomboid family serine protease